jgi:DNA processing protein
MDDPPASITLRGGPLDAMHAVAIIGTREPSEEAVRFTRDLAAAVVLAGAVVISGGAAGIDAAAHEGAMEAGGRTWVVAATGHERCYPEHHADLFERVGRGPGTMLWPFAPPYRHRTGFHIRNRILVALADAVVVTQAGYPSGALHAARAAERAGKPLWVVPAAPWMGNGGDHAPPPELEDEPKPATFEGSIQLLARGVRPLISPQPLLETLGLSAPSAEGPPKPAPPTRQLSLSPSESRILDAISHVPLHTDSIALRAGESGQTTTAALLTLALEDVVVEGPPGFFRRRKPSNA